MKKIFILTIIALSLGTSVYAQSTVGGNTGGNPANNPLPTYTLLEPLPCVPSQNPEADDPCTASTAGQPQTQLNFKYYVQYLFNLAIALAAVSAVFMIVWGGFQYMSTDSWQGKGAGLEKVKNAALGLLLVLTSYIILRTIDPRLVAIPTTLVPPLSIRYESVSAGIFSELSKEASAFRTNMAETQKMLTDTEKKNAERTALIVRAATEIEELKKNSSLSDEELAKEIETLEAEIDSLSDEIRRDTANSKLVIGKTALDVTARPYNYKDGFLNVNWTKAVQEVEKVYEVQKSQLENLAPDPDQLQALEKYKERKLVELAIGQEASMVFQIQVEYDNQTGMLKTEAAKKALVADLTQKNAIIEDRIQKIRTDRIINNPNEETRIFLMKKANEAVEATRALVAKAKTL
ncbi:MAG: hypothetical protein AAB381_01460 [Patescibacteria group bacterium]